MAVIRKPVDDRNMRIFRHLLHNVMGEGANHDALHHALQVLRDVVHRFSLPKIDFRRREIERKTAELVDTDIESDPGAKRRLFKDHRQRLSLERVAVGARNCLNLAGEVEKALDLPRRKVANRQKVVGPHLPATSATAFLRAVKWVRISASPGFVSSSAS